MDKVYEACREFLKQVEIGRAPAVEIIGSHVKKLRAAGVRVDARPLPESPGVVVELSPRAQLYAEYTRYLEDWKNTPWQQRAEYPLNFMAWLDAEAPRYSYSAHAGG